MIDVTTYWPAVLRRILDGVVIKPDRLKVDCEVLPSSFRLVVEPDVQSGDSGRVLGKKGRMVAAIDHIIGLAASNLGQRVQVSVVSENANGVRTPLEFLPAVNWSKINDEQAIARLKFIADLVIKGTFKIQAYEVANTTALIIFTKGVDVLEKTVESLNIVMAPWGRVHGRRITVELKRE